MEKIKCNVCGASDVEPKIVVQDRADLSFGEVQLCPECGSEDIDADESDCLKINNTSNVKHTTMSVKFKALKELHVFLYLEGVDAHTEIRFQEISDASNLYALQVSCADSDLLSRLALFWGCAFADLPARTASAFEASDTWHGRGASNLRELADELIQHAGEFFDIKLTVRQIEELASHHVESTKRPQHLHVILAALRSYQQRCGQDPELDRIATNDGAFPLPTPEDIDELCESLNFGDTTVSVKFKALKELNTCLQEVDTRIRPIKLIAQNGYLYINWDDILSNSSDKTAQGNQRLALRYFTGGCDEVCWPKPDIAALRGALDDARETGWIRHVDSVLLPDDTEFFIDQPYWKAGDHITWTDPDDCICSRTGILQSVTYLNDSELHIVLEDDWAAEVNESELRHA
jgi:hypothetical protein